MNEIERLKENIPPKRDGYRVVDLLTNASEIKEKYNSLENTLNNQSSDEDPLGPWFKLACFSKIHFADLGLSRTQLIALYDKVINMFINIPMYKNDRRYVKIWLYYCTMVNDVETAFSKLRATGIGELVAERYIANAEYLVRKKRVQEAKDIVNKAVCILTDSQLKIILSFKEELDTLKSENERVGIMEITPFYQAPQDFEYLDVLSTSATSSQRDLTKLQPYRNRDKENSTPFEKLIAVPKSPSAAKAKAAFSIYFDETGPTISYYNRDSREVREVTYQIFKKFSNAEKPPPFKEGQEVKIGGKVIKVLSMIQKGKLDCWLCEYDSKNITLCVPTVKSRTVFLSQANIARWCGSLMIASFHSLTLGNCLVMPSNYVFLSDYNCTTQDEVHRITLGILTAVETLWKYQAIHGSISSDSFIISQNNVQIFSYASMFLPERVSIGLKNGISLPIEQLVIEIDSIPLAHVLYKLWAGTQLITEMEGGRPVPKRKIEDQFLREMITELLDFKSSIVVQAKKSLLKDESAFKISFNEGRKMIRRLIGRLPVKSE